MVDESHDWLYSVSRMSVLNATRNLYQKASAEHPDDDDDRRRSKDSSIDTNARLTDNKQGGNGRKRDFLDFCHDIDAQILNGCLSPDLEQGGLPTHYKVLTDGQISTSVLDYALASTSLLPRLQSFHVSHFLPSTDHAPITVGIRLELQLKASQKPPQPFQFRKPRPHYAARDTDQIALRLVQQDNSQDKFGHRLWRPPGPSAQPPLVVYTDGSCAKEGDELKAGCGIHYPENPENDIAARLPGMQTNNRAELFAVIIAIEHSDLLRPLEIYTDSQHTIQTLCRWSLSWLQTGFRTRSAEAHNEDLVLRAVAAIQKRQTTIHFHWVKGHSGDDGNDIADKLANDGRNAAVWQLADLQPQPPLPHFSPLLAIPTRKVSTSLPPSPHTDVDLSDLLRPAELDLDLGDDRQAVLEAAAAFHADNQQDSLKKYAKLRNKYNKHRRQ